MCLTVILGGGFNKCVSLLFKGKIQALDPISQGLLWTRPMGPHPHHFPFKRIIHERVNEAFKGERVGVGANGPGSEKAL